MSSLSDLSKESSRSVVDIMLSRIREFVDDVVKVSGVGDEAVRSNVCVLSQAMANICSTVEGREYFLHPKAARQMEAIAQIVAKCVEVVVANDKLEVFCRESGSLVGIVAKIVGHLGDVLSKTLLLPQSRQSRVRVEVARKMLEVLEVLRLKRGRTSGEVLNVVAMLENSMETFLFALLKTARGVEVVESFGLLSYCAQRLLSPSNLGGKYSWLEAGVLVSQMTSCGEGMRSLEKTCFVEHRLVEVWRLLEGSGSGDATSVEDGEDVESPLDDALDGGRDVDCEALSVADLGERVVLKAFMDRAVLLDSATKLGKLCRPDETQMFGLRFLSAIVGSLDTFLLLEWRFGIRRMLLNAQLQNGLDEEEEVAEDGEFVIDEGLIERNRLLVKCSILGGASERLLPPRGICEHSADPYPYPIVAALSSDQMEKYTDKMKQIGHCRRCADDLGAVPMPCKRPTSISLVSVVISSLKQSSSGHWKTEHPILLKCPRLQAKIRNVAKLLSQLNKQTLAPSSAGSCVLPSWEEVAMSLIIDYGRRVNALDATLPHSSRKQDLAGLLWHAGNARRLGRRSRGSLQHADHAEGSVEEHEVGGGEAFKPFDWFVAVVYLLFNGSTIRAVDFLNRLEGTSLAHYLWAPAAVEMPSSHHYTVCHLFEMVFASELPQLYNTFQLSGYSPSVVLRCWLNQCYVNYLDWSEIEDFLLLCLLCGPGMIVFSAVAMMRHLSMRLVTALQAKNHLQVLLVR
ncbi:Protein broad-minded [Taenia solium]|eukprot:TsM_000870000 transcript=TsM_000870000 gene=TsM_000870000